MSFIFFENYTEGWGTFFRIKEILCHKESKYQKIEIFESWDHGKVMVIDGAVMFTEKDEFTYHEMIVHVPMFSHPNPERILVIGGGDGGTVREILKHDTVKEVLLVEIDEVVIELAEKYFPQTTCELKNPKTKILVRDGIEFLKECQEAYFDLIIVDSTDPVGPAVGLFESDFYNACYRALKDDGILNVQSGSPYFQKDLIEKVKNTISMIFPIARVYIAGVPMYGGLWSFTIGSKKYDPKMGPVREDYKITSNLKYYNYDIHRGAFALPNYLRKGV
ncbi:MAG: polyamine aminopropyltransferase [Thermosulfidibacteraceae bacterium]